MPRKKIIEHHCGGKMECCCRHRITRAAADLLVAEGMALWVAGDKEIRVTKLGKLKLLRPRTIGEREIVRAYVEGDPTAKERITIYGDKNALALQALGAQIKFAEVRDDLPSNSTQHVPQ